MRSGFEDSSLFDLFRMEAEEQVLVLQTGLIQLEEGAASAATLEALMRASHSLKGAARIVGLDPIVHLTHAMEDRFVAAQEGRALDSSDIDRMLKATDWLSELRAVDEGNVVLWLDSNAAAIDACATGFHEQSPAVEQETQAVDPASGQAPGPVERAAHASDDPPRTGPDTTPDTSLARQPGKETPPVSVGNPDNANSDRDIFSQPGQEERANRERTVRLTADRFDNLLSLSAETLVSARQLATWGDVLDRNHRAIGKALQMLEEAAESPQSRSLVRRELERQVAVLATQISDLDQVSRANEFTAERLYRAMLGGRLRPFQEGITGVARLVRDTARELGKSVKLEIQGESTRVDRDILDRLEAPISHLVTNAIDHGIELPAQRVAKGKSAEAHLRIHAGHENGRLVITVRDDGGGIDPEQIRARILRRNLAPAETVPGLSEAELLEFLFLPGFSTRDTTSLLSGRGVGLNVVQSMVQEAGGGVTVTSSLGAGTIFRLTLPVTRSVIRVIRVLADGELFSVPMVRIDHVAHLEPEGDSKKPEARWNDRAHPVIVLASILGLADQPLPKDRSRCCSPAALLSLSINSSIRPSSRCAGSIRGSERSPASVQRRSTKTDSRF